MDRTDYDTIGGWLYSRVDAIPPEIGQSVEYDGYLFIIEETEHKRISRVHVMKLEMLVEEEGA
ncbi:Transporter associated domain protein [compost metagenome]